MLEKSKTAFYNLLTKIDAIDISESSYRNDALETQFSNIEDEYKKLRRAILTKLEDIKCTSDILNQGFGTNHIEILNNPLKKASDKIITEINSIEMQEKIIPFNLIKGEWLFCQGRIKEGQDCWEKVLKVDLYNNYIYSKLIEIRHSTSGLKGLIEDLKKKYRFEYMGSFGHNISKGTSDITVSEYDGSIYACNLKANKIIKFNANGDYICSISADLKKPYGIFTDEDNIWICDMNNSRLVLVDSKGCLLKKIIIKDIVGCKFSQTKPILGTLHKNRIYLILKNDHSCPKTSLE